MINRQLKSNITLRLNTGKAIIIIGARQTGKTSLLENMFSSKNVLWLDADEPDVREMFTNTSSASLKALFSAYDTIVVDEAQRIKDVGLKFKLITDHIKDKQLIATGSSSFELTNKLNEPLTGRKWEYMLYPISFAEMVNHHGLLEEKRLLDHRLLYGYYPDVVSNPGNEKEILRQLTDSYLYKDILMWQNIKKPEKLVKLLQALAFQVCSEVSYNELGKTIGLDNETVEKYIQLLEKSFVIFRLRSFSRNLRKELKKSSKIYFYDNGVRNSLIANFSPITLRQDVGALWENFFVSERIKYNHYNNRWTNKYFWRTHDQQEIDYLEESDGKLSVFEIKWNENRKPYLSKTFDRAYTNNEYHVISRDNYDRFIV